MPLQPRPNVLGMQPYSPGRPIEEVQRELGLTEVIKLASNENPLGPSPKAVEAVREAASRMHLYPDAAAFELREVIALTFGFDLGSVAVGNGSDEFLHLLGLLLIQSPDDEVLTGDPSFVRYDSTAQLAPCKLIKAPVNAKLEIDLEALAGHLNERTRIVFLANPNNPTGTIFRKAGFEKFLAQVPDTALVVLDEAYHEFAASEPDYPKGFEYVRSHPNVVVLRTLSKAYGLAGVRVGMMFADPTLITHLNRIRMPFNVNSLGQVAAIAALRDHDYVSQSVAHNARALASLRASLEAVGARVYESFANFVLADMGQPAQPLFEALLREGVIVRSGHVLGLPTCLRVSVGTEEEMKKFDQAIRTVMTAEVSA